MNRIDGQDRTAAIAGWSQDRWIRHDDLFDERPWVALPSQVRRSSVGRPWRGLAVWHQVAPSGDLYIPPLSPLCILVRRAVPTDVLCRLGGIVETVHWRPGEVIVLPPGVPSFWRSSMPRDNLLLHLDPSWLQRGASGPWALDLCFGRADPVIAGLAEVLLASLDDDASRCPQFADGIAAALSSHVLARYARPPGFAARIGGFSRRQMDCLEDAVAADLPRPWTVERLARLVGLSTFHFARTFKASFGLTPRAWITRRRMDAAAHLVCSTDRPLSDIAAEVGYPSAAHFAQVFLRNFGVAPSAYRRGARAPVTACDPDLP